MKHLLMGVAAIALATSPALSQGNGNGNGKGNGGGGKPEQGQSMKGNGPGGGGGGGKPDRGPQMTQQDRGGPSMKEARGPSMKEAKADNRGPAVKAAKADDRGPAMKAQKPDNRGADWDRGNRGNGNNSDVRVVRAEGPERAYRTSQDGRRIYETRDSREWWGDYNQRYVIDGCPPGLAKKNNGCMPPGLAKDRYDDYRFGTYRPDWWGLASLGLGGGNYLYNDGYLLRYNGGNILGYVPLLGGALSVGNPWPTYYAPRPVPQYYVNYYDLGPQGGYRYADNALYRVDPQTAAITSIAALLTGDQIQVGSPMPMGYDVYNVPYPYRSQYYDSPTANYRYSDGYIYQVDPTTQLVAAAIELLAG
ncbi:hypothetical protein [Tsuneonella sp. HG222]